GESLVMPYRRVWIVLVGTVICISAPLAAQDGKVDEATHRGERAQPKTRPRPFRIQVVDQETGRGVPLVELRTVNQVPFVTDSNGVVAFDEAGLFDRKVFFSIFSHGYEVAKDGFGYRGKALGITEGGTARIAIQRRNIAERLYRVTGAGIYQDSV